MTQHAPSADTLNAWLVEQGLEGTPQETLLDGYCARLVAMGIPLMRLHVSQSAFHPKYGGLGFEWWRNREVTSERYEFSETPASMWVESPFYQILRTGLMEHRERLSQSGPPSRFPLLNGLCAEGATDYFATGLAMEPREQSLPMNPDSPPEGLLVSWVGDRQGGFRDAELQTFRGSLPFLALVLKSAANRQVASELLRIYLGRDAGRRVLSGELQRGSTQRIDAVICYFDLTGFTALAEQVPGPELIAMLNDYFGLMVSAIQARGGHILKFMGDGLLAMFDQDDQGQAADAALDTAASLRRDLIAHNRGRRNTGLPITGFTMALHAGEILYGNIGAENRLDFTVIGPAVNLTARLSGMHRLVGQQIILSERVQKAATQGRHDLVSLGRHMLRGVSEPCELFTIYEPE